jgi:hypothetical protein
LVEVSAAVADGAFFSVAFFEVLAGERGSGFVACDLLGELRAGVAVAAGQGLACRACVRGGTSRRLAQGARCGATAVDDCQLERL